MKQKFRYQDFVDELRAGNLDGVFIDETGSPGLQTKTRALHSERKSWVGVIVPRSHMKEVWEQLPHALDELSRLTRANEFHFTDIYGGRKQFVEVPLEVRLGIFRFMAHIFSIYGFPIFVQTLDPNSLGKLQSQMAWPSRVGPFNTEKHQDLALLILLWRIKSYLNKRAARPFCSARVFVDEGYMKDGVSIDIPHWEDTFADGLVCFAKSNIILPIQLADFAAFCLNRTQILLEKSDLSDLDHEFLSIIQPVASNFQNIEVIQMQDWLGKSEGTSH